MIEIILLGYVLPLILMLLYTIYLDKDVKTVGDLFKYGAFIFIPILNWMGLFIIAIGTLIERLGKTKLSVLWNRFLNIKFKKL
jgi:hypothetical protein